MKILRHLYQHIASLVIVLLLISCGSGTPETPPNLILEDTTVARAEQIIDSMEKKAPPSVQAVKCDKLKESAFYSMGCCSELCTDGLQLKAQDCCCDGVLEAYEKAYQENYTTQKGRAKIGKLENDLVFTKCKRRYPDKVKAIKAKYVPKPETGKAAYNPYD